MYCITFNLERTFDGFFVSYRIPTGKCFLQKDMFTFLVDKNNIRLFKTYTVAYFFMRHLRLYKYNSSTVINIAIEEY